MTIASFPFLAFVALAALLHAAAPGARVKQLAMLAANLVFLSTFASAPAAFVPLFGFLAAAYGGLRSMGATRSRPARMAIIAVILIGFFWLKRYSFLPSATFLPFSYTTIGLSYIFFRVMHLLIDASSEDGEPKRIGVLAFANYTLNFTTLVSGPIQLFQDFAAAPLPFGWADFGFATERIALGFFKVIVLAAILNTVHLDGLAALPAAATPAERVHAALLLSVGYTFYLYCNFSGYTDIVIGAARLFRLRLPENFNYPFAAPNFMIFWQRWHMTLTEWLKTYVYNPFVIALMTRFPARSLQEAQGILAFFVTFFLIGLWHGQTAVFALYGVLLGLGVSLNKGHQLAMTAWLGRRRYRAVAETFWYRTFARGLTFTWFTLSLFCFWGSWSDIVLVTGGLGWAGGAAFVGALLALSSPVLAVAEALRERLTGAALLESRYTRTVWTTMLAAIAFAALTLMASPAPDIVYKTF